MTVSLESIASIAGQRFYWWRDLGWARAHLTETCLDAFLENPVGFGGLNGIAPAQRMRSGRGRQAAAKGLSSCRSCHVRLVRSRLEAATARGEQVVRNSD